MSNWTIVALNLIIIAECFAIALWFASDLTNKLMRSIAGVFVVLACGILLFALPRDFLFALGIEVDAFWFSSREASIVPWRISMAAAFGIFLITLRFGDWTPNGRG